MSYKQILFRSAMHDKILCGTAKFVGGIGTTIKNTVLSVGILPQIEATIAEIGEPLRECRLEPETEI